MSKSKESGHEESMSKAKNENKQNQNQPNNKV